MLHCVHCPLEHDLQVEGQEMHVMVVVSAVVEGGHIGMQLSGPFAGVYFYKPGEH